MTKQKSTKCALLVSALALLVCITMLIGSTFAWFTDSVTSAGNIIKSGTLEVTMEWKDATTNGKVQSYTDASQGAIFNYDKWEPGYVEAKNIKITNAGTLALKYQLNVIANGEVSALANVIDVYFAEGDITLADRTMTELRKIGTLAEVLAGMPANVSGDLLENESDKVTIALKMQEDAGNEYQGLAIGSDFSIQLLATQLTSEFDSFDDQYDKDADYDGEISNATSLAAAFANGGNYKVTADIVVDDVVVIPEGKEVVLDLNGNTLSKSVDSGIVVRNYGKLALTGNGTVDGTISNYAIRTEPGSELTINEGIVVDGGFGAVSCFGGKLTINGGDFSNEESNTTHYVVYATNNSTVVINGGKFAFGEDQYAGANGSPILASTNGSTIGINGGTFEATGGSALCYNANNIVIKGGTFKNRAYNTYGGTIEGKVAAGYEVTDNGNGTWTVSMSQATAKDAILAAANSGTPVTLPAGNYTMPGDDIRGKTLTIKGTKDTVIDVSNIDTRNQFVTGSTIVFDGVTLKFNESDSSKLYMGFANTANLTYKNCYITGLQVLNGETVTFENCVIDSSANTMGQPHSVWTYGAKTVNFIDCDFIYGHRAINCYKDQDIEGGKQVVNFKNCTFTTTDANSEGAVEINSSPFSVGIEVNMEGCTAPANGPMAYVSPWDPTDGAKTTINIK